MSYPDFVPSLSMDVSRISPAPRSVPSRAHETASRPVSCRPPCVYTDHEPCMFAFASIASTTHWLPNVDAHSFRSAGRSTAAELTATLSAPARRTARMSETDRTPPPTVRGMPTVAAVRCTTSRSVERCSCVAVMSRKQISSAPCAAYLAASSTGSPASVMSTNWTPLTTRPSATSRQGMTRLRNTARLSHARHEVRQQPEPCCTTAFRVELDADSDAGSNRRDEAPAVVRCCDGLITGDRHRRI